MRRSAAVLALVAAALAAGIWLGRRGTGGVPAAAISTNALPEGRPSAAAPASAGAASVGRQSASSDRSGPRRSPAELVRRFHDAEDPAERTAALAAFRAADPDNALGPYLAASEAARRGDPIAAAAALVDARLARPMRKRDLEAVMEAEARLRAAGMGDAEALDEAMESRDGRTTEALGELGIGLVELQRVFIGLGDWDEADFLLEATLDLGADLRESETLADGLAGVFMERALLEALDPDTVIGWDGERAGERLEWLGTEQAEILRLLDSAWESRAPLDAAGWAEYRRRLAEDGERAALRWARDRR